jgi:hypothetical protein
MLRFSKHSEPFFSNLLVAIARAAEVVQEQNAVREAKIREL